MGYRYKLGRSYSCSLQILDESVSLEHAIFIDAGENFKIEDISHNGTYIERRGAKRRLQRHFIEELKPDDVLYFGFNEEPFYVTDIINEIKILKLPVGSQKVRCPIHGIIHLEGNGCPMCPQ
ncbi:FHA domain-containing protein [Myxococcota bacterium]|nr:FHA domain-containing protein [Myxococcota bacterium]MBU1382031.1 FHA domain-containing protein [Myxococcota bacterium]MBU1495327.1 FHA domain-containing protein [Myxococcota bacterium]